MNKILTLIILFFQYTLCFSQNIFTDIQGKNVNDFIKLEKNNGNEIYNTGQEYILLNGLAQPMIFKRNEKEIPDLLVYYYFNSNDSVVKDILYEWDVYNFDKGDSSVKSMEFCNSLINKYNELLKYLTEKFGKSDSTGNLTEISNINEAGGLNREDTWILTDSTQIDMYTTISNYYKKNSFATISPTHRIRLYIKDIK